MRTTPTCRPIVRRGRHSRLAPAGAVGALLLSVVALSGPREAWATPGPSATPALSSTIIFSDARTIALRQWFSPENAGTGSESNRDFTWTAPSTTESVDVVVVGGGGGGGGGKGGNHGNSTSPNVRGAGGGGGGGGEVRRDSAVSVTPGETLYARVGAGGAAGTGQSNASVNLTPGGSGGTGIASWLERSDGNVLVFSSGGLGGEGGVNSGGSTTSSGGAGGSGAPDGTGGTLLTAGLDGVTGSNASAPPGAASALDNSGSGWLYHGLRLAGGGGGGGGKSSNGGASSTISAGTTASTAAVHNLANLASTITRIGGDGDGGNNAYVSDVTKHAPTYLGGGGGGGAFVFSSGRAAGRGGSGAILLTYAVADLVVSEITPAAGTIPVSTGSTVITLQLRDAAGTATNISVGPIEMAVSGTDATLGSVTDNGDGTYSVTLTAGSTAGTATVSAKVVGSDFTDTASVTIEAPATSSTLPDPTDPPGKPGVPSVTPVPGGLEVTVVPPTSGGTPASYVVTAQPGGRTCTVTGSTGSCTIDGLSSTEGYSVTVVASNDGGDSAPSDASGPHSPMGGDSAGGSLALAGFRPAYLLAVGLGALTTGGLMTAWDRRLRPVTVGGRRTRR